MQKMICSFISTVFTLNVILSFDEGPSKNTIAISEKLKSLSLNASFHLVPEAFFKVGIVDKLINDGHSIGILVQEDFSIDAEESDVEQVVIKSLDLFIKKTGYKPKLLRFSRYGWPKVADKVGEKLGLIVTKPNLDSEDIECPYFTEFLIPKILEMSHEDVNISIVFRCRYKSTLDSIDEIKDTSKNNGIKIVGYTEILNQCLRPMRIIVKNESQSETIKDLEPKNNVNDTPNDKMVNGNEEIVNDVVVGLTESVIEEAIVNNVDQETNNIDSFEINIPDDISLHSEITNDVVNNPEVVENNEEALIQNDQQVTAMVAESHALKISIFHPLMFLLCFI